MFMPACFIYLPSLAWIILPMQWRLQLGNLLTFAPWRLYILCSSLLSGFNLLNLLQQPESPKYLLSINRKEDALEVLRQMYAINRKLPPEVTHIKNGFTHRKPLLSVVEEINNHLMFSRHSP